MAASFQKERGMAVVLDNILLALNSLRANKMRALLTMLGIIIGIGSVIGIVTVGNSMTGSITDSISSFGINNITVSLTRKSSDSAEEQGTASVRMFGSSSPDEEDLMTDDMIAEFRMAYADQIKAIALTESLGTATAKVDEASSSVNLTGANPDVAVSDHLEIVSGRFLKEYDLEAEKKSVWYLIHWRRNFMARLLTALARPWN